MKKLSGKWKYIKQQIDQLLQKREAQNGKLASYELKKLDELQRDWELLRRNKLVGEEDAEDAEEAFGEESVYFDYEWNPLGKAPKGMKNFRQRHIKSRSQLSAGGDDKLAGIPLPTEDEPKFIRNRSLVQTVYSGEASTIPVATSTSSRGISTSTLVPSVLSRKRKLADISADVTHGESTEKLASEDYEREKQARADDLDDLDNQEDLQADQADEHDFTDDESV